MKADFERVLTGMSMAQVEGILGPPEESHTTRFGADMVTWAYRDNGQRMFVWFDGSGRVKLKSGI